MTPDIFFGHNPLLKVMVWTSLDVFPAPIRIIRWWTRALTSEADRSLNSDRSEI